MGYQNQKVELGLGSQRHRSTTKKWHTKVENDKRKPVAEALRKTKK